MATISASPRSMAGSMRGSVALPGIGPWRRPAQELTPAEIDPPVVGTAQARVGGRLFAAGIAVFLIALVLSGFMANAGRHVAAVIPSQAVAAADVESVALPAWTVSSGDTLWTIAVAVDPASDPRVMVAQLRTLNGLSPDHVLQVGEVLQVPTV